MTKNYEKAYESKKGYLFTHFNMGMVLPTDVEDDRIFDVVDMIYDYLDTINVEKTRNKVVLGGFIAFAYNNYTKYEIDEYGERVHR